MTIRARITVVCIAIAALLITTGTPTIAAPHAPLQANVHLADAKAGAGLTGASSGSVQPNVLTGIQYGYTCAALGNPEPQLVANTQTIHWGLKFYCDHVAQVSIKGQLQELVGSTWTVQDKFPTTGYYPFVGASWGYTTATACLDTTLNSWRLVVWIIIDGSVGTPNPGISNTYVYHCG